jgi:hypothetical protein
MDKGNIMPPELKPELLPCPFCDDGGSVNFSNMRINKDLWVIVKCWSCGVKSREYSTRLNAALAWNTRAPAPARENDVVELARTIRNALHKMGILDEQKLTEEGNKRLMSVYIAEHINSTALQSQAVAARTLNCGWCHNEGCERCTPAATPDAKVLENRLFILMTNLRLHDGLSQSHQDLIMNAVKDLSRSVPMGDVPLKLSPIKSVTLGPVLEGRITEREAVDLINTVINSQIEIYNEALQAEAKGR